MLKQRNDLIFFIMLFALGTVMAVQFRTVLTMNSSKTEVAKYIEELKNQINDEKNIGKALTDEIKANEKLVESYLKVAVDVENSSYLKNQKELLDQLRLKAGLSDVTGAGLIIKLDDAPARKNVNPNSLIIHDSDIVRILNELKIAGAQAISINNERIIATSEQICAGPTIRLNHNRYPVPYVIQAIGSPDRMYDALMKSETVALMLSDKIKVEISKSKNLNIPKFIVKNFDSMFSGLEVVTK